MKRKRYTEEQALSRLLIKLWRLLRGFITYQLMLQRKTSHQSELELVSIEALVPADHLLRKIDKAIDFSFIYA